MVRVYSCLANQHDLRLVLLAGAICLIAALTSLATFDQARIDARRRAILVALAGLVSGTGIWATHFVAMLAYQPGLPIGYDVSITLISIVAAVLITGCGWATALHRNPMVAAAGGPIIGLGVGCMHFIGMMAIDLQGHIAWDLGLVIVSILLGMGLAGAALAVHRLRRRGTSWIGALVLTVAICSMHFTGMAAAVVHPDPSIQVAFGVLDSETVAVVVAVAALLILAVGFGLVLFDRKLAQAQLLEAQERAALANEVLLGAAERERLAAELKRQSDIVTAALENMAQGLSMYDEQDRLVTFNSRYAEIYGLPGELLAERASFTEIFDHMVSRGNLAAPTERRGLPELRRTVAKGSKLKAGEAEIWTKAGRIITIQTRPTADGGWVATHEDVTERRQAVERIAYLATHDPLTGLANRVAFGDRLKTAAASAKRGRRFAVHSIDLDRFKEVNDTLGHPFGDHILKKVAERLRAVVREDDVITRLGGDEFAMLQNIDEPADAAALAQRVLEALAEPVEFGGHTITIGASVGVSLAPGDGVDADELLRMSDVALYRAKSDTRGSFRFFELGMDLSQRERRDLETDLREAVREGQFEIHYQPQLNVRNRSIACFEALVRWRHPTRGLVQPLDFIGLAEECGLIVPIGEWVLRQACRDAALWPSEVRVAVNLSPAQFKCGDLLSMIVSALGAAALAPQRLELEITESVLIRDEARVRSTLDQLSRFGVGLVMDDFGTGYSSLSNLRSFPFSMIKIDQAFVADLTKTTDALAIVQATIQLSEKLGIKTTAEGVETAEQMDILAAEGCTQVQGYHVSRPVPVEQVSELLLLYGSGACQARAA